MLHVWENRREMTLDTLSSAVSVDAAHISSFYTKQQQQFKTASVLAERWHACEQYDMLVQ